MLRFTIRELFLLVVIAGLAVALYVDRRETGLVRQQYSELQWRFEQLVVDGLIWPTLAVEWGRRRGRR